MVKSAIIVDDEPLLADYLQGKLSKLWPELEVVGIAHNGRKAISLAEQVQPDVAFLDIHMPGLTGLQVAGSLPEKTQIVFVTAFDDYAIEAFQRAAVDYLLKPVTEVRLQKTIERLQNSPAVHRSDLMSLLKEAAGVSYLHWLRVGYGDTTVLVQDSDVVYLKSNQKYTDVVTQDKTYVIRQSIKELEDTLDPDQFWRIHRGIIVRVDQVVAAKRDLRGRYVLTLRDTKEQLICSQSYGHLFKQM
mgnify:FL=1|tara:strand:- start:3815 stop:4549 length:735 start_codon:yes stop_codon:yes gene_type:complete